MIELSDNTLNKSNLRQPDHQNRGRREDRMTRESEMRDDLLDLI